MKKKLKIFKLSETFRFLEVVARCSEIFEFQNFTLYQIMKLLWFFAKTYFCWHI